MCLKDFYYKNYCSWYDKNKWCDMYLGCLVDVGVLFGLDDVPTTDGQYILLEAEYNKVERDKKLAFANMNYFFDLYLQECKKELLKK